MNFKFKLNELYVFLLIVILLLMIFSYALFGLAGARVVLGIIFMSLPFYILLNSFELTEGEKFIFSILMGLALFPSLVYLLGLVISFRIAIIVAFLVFIVVGFVVRKYKSKKTE